MIRRHPLRVLMVVALFGIGACGGDDDTVDTSPPAVEVGEAWDLLYISTSQGFEVAEFYADRTEQALGVTVNVHDKATGDLQATTVLERISDDSERGWADLVREAEIIVVFGSPRDSGDTSDVGICFTRGSTEPPVHYSAEDFQPYRDLLDEIYAEIWSLRDGEPVVLRATDFYVPAVSKLRDAGRHRECAAGIEAANLTMSQAAEAGGATLVSVAELFNGPQYDEDPDDKGYIEGDGIHTNDQGAAAIADALAATGFEPATAP